MGFFLLRFSTLSHLPPLDSAVSEDAELEPRTVATLALTARRSNHLDRSHPHIRLDLIHYSAIESATTRLDLIHILI